MNTIDLVMFRTLGDVLMTTPIIAAVREKYPAAKIRFHVEESYKDLLVGNPHINEIVTHRPGCYTDIYEYIAKNPTDHIARMAMANHYDTLWHHTPKTRNQHMMDWYASRTGLDIKLQNYHIQFSSDEESREAVKNILPKKYFVFHTTSRVPSKDWPAVYFGKLANLIQEKNSELELVQIGSSTDNRVPGALDLCGKLSLKQTMAIIEKAMFYIGGDSGPSYMAEAALIPTFIILGSTMAIPELSGQRGPFVGPIGPSVRYISPDRPNENVCKPISCYTHCQLNKPCIVGIMPEKVLEVVQEVVTC